MINISKVVSLLFSLFLGFSAQSQDTLLIELFDDSTLGQFSQFSVTGDNENWIAADYNENFFSQMNGYNGTSVVENEDWLISPVINMDEYADEVLNFENASSFNGPNLELLISVDYEGTGDPTLATWMDMTTNATWSPGQYEYVNSGDIDLSAITGTAYIAFKYTSSPTLEGKLYQLDNIAVTASSDPSAINDSKIIEKISSPYVNNGNLIFSVLDAFSDIYISLVSTDGKLVPQFNNQKVSGDVILPIGGLSNGIYILIAKSEGTVSSYKFVK